MPTTTRVLITVLTYPHPSRQYEELVCTAGITEDGEWVRLYPIDYRYLPRNLQFKKYQWIELDLDERGDGNDKRKESRRPYADTIRILGEPISPKNDWRQRREIIDPLPINTVKELRKLYDKDKTSLGIVKPSKIIEVKVEAASREWKPEWKAIYDQFRLFGSPPKPLTKIPYKFSYVFECEDSDRPHSAMIEDWELGILFLKEVDRLGSEAAGIESVKNNYFSMMCDSKRDTLLYMGTTFPYNSWVVLGVYYPPKIVQSGLFS